jgi:hypothetical protein
MSENTLRRADEVGTACRLGSQSDDEGGGIRHGDLRGDDRPSIQRRPLEVKEQEHPTEEAESSTAFAQLVSGPGGREAGALLLPLGIPGHDGHGSQYGVNPGDEAQAPIASIETDDTRADLIETDGPFQEWSGKGSIMDIGRREQKEERQARAVAEQGMHAIAAQEWAGMLSRCMADSGIGVAASPRKARAHCQ